MTEPTPYLGSWRYRRAVVFLALGFLGWLLGYIVTVFGEKLDPASLVVIALSILALIASIIGCYVFAAVWDDASIRKSITGR